MNIKWARGRIFREDNQGDGGGSGGAPASAPATPEPSSSPGPSAPSGPSAPAEMSYARHSSDREPTEAEVQNVTRILDKGKDPSHTLSMDEIQAILGMPIKFKPNDPPVGETEPDPAAVVASAVVAPVVDPAAAASTLSPDMKALVDALKDVVGAKPDPASVAQTPPADSKPKKFYGEVRPAIEVAPQLADAIFNAESPQQARAGLNFLLNGVMNQLADDMNGQILKAAKLMMGHMPQVARQTAETHSFGEKFYGKNPELNKEAIKPIVGQLAAAMTREYTKVGRPVGDDAFNTALAEATHKFLEVQLGRSLRPDTKIVQAPATKVVAPAQPKKQPWIAPGGARPAAPVPNGKDSWQDLVI